MSKSDLELYKNFLTDELISIEDDLNRLLTALGVEREECDSAARSQITGVKNVQRALLGFCFNSVDSLRQALHNADLSFALESYGKLKYFHGWALGAIEDSNYKSQKMSEYATLAHAEDKRKREEIIEYWRKHITPKTSNEKAADLLSEHFPDVSHRTLVKYVSAEKKKIQIAPCQQSVMPTGS